MDSQSEYVTVKVNWVAKAAHGYVRLRRSLIDSIAEKKGIIEVLWRTLRVELSLSKPGRIVISFEGTLPNQSSALIFQVVDDAELLSVEAPAYRLS